MALTRATAGLDADGTQGCEVGSSVQLVREEKHSEDAAFIATLKAQV